MKLVPNAKQIAVRAHSMWANYLGILCLLAPEAIYWATERDTNPRVWWLAGIALIVYGIVGRLKDQTIDKTRSSAMATFAALLLSGMSLFPHPEPAQTVATGSEVSVAAFVEVSIPLIAKWEGKRNEAYRDIVDVWTICYGHTKGVRAGQYMTDAECLALLHEEVLQYRTGLHRHFTPFTKTKRLTPQRDAAYVSLAYNVGIHGAGNSTAVRRLNDGDIVGGCDALGWWNKAGGRVVRGLVRRRAEEVELCKAGLT